MKKSERVEEGPACGRCKTTNRPERSFCRKCGRFLGVSHLQRKTRELRRGKRPKPMSARRLSEVERRAEVVAVVHERDKVCQGEAIRALTGIPCSGPLEVHELVSRAQWAKGYLEPTNCKLLCHQHHRFVTTHPHSGHALGLHLWSWERPA